MALAGVEGTSDAANSMPFPNETSSSVPASLIDVGDTTIA